MSPSQFISKLKELDEEGVLDEALDLIYNKFGELGAKNDFKTMDEILKDPSIESFSIDCTIGLLTASRSYRKQLSMRTKVLKILKTG